MRSGNIRRVSVIVLNWNGRSHLETCLPALARQSRLPDEVIVVDNHSTCDDSVDYVRTVHPGVHCIALGENRGFSGGNNAGLAVASGDVVVLLNNDTRPEDDWLEQLLACAAAHPDAGIVAAHLVDWTGATTDSAGDGCRATGRGFGRHRRQPSHSAPPTGEVFGACAGAALYRREMIEEVGFLDEDFFLNFEDTDLSFRARLRGWKAWFCREAVVHHRISASQGTWTATNAYYGARNHLWVCAKNMPGAVLMRNLPLNLIEIFAMGLAAARHGVGLAYLRGFAAGVLGMRRMLHKRRVIMEQATVHPREIEAWLTPLNLSIGALRRLLRTP